MISIKPSVTSDYIQIYTYIHIYTNIYTYMISPGEAPLGISGLIALPASGWLPRIINMHALKQVLKPCMWAWSVAPSASKLAPKLHERAPLGIREEPQNLPLVGTWSHPQQTFLGWWSLLANFLECRQTSPLVDQLSSRLPPPAPTAPPSV